MTRIVGNFGTPVSGTLYVKASANFVGGITEWTSYAVIDGEIDINLPPTPRGIFYLVDFQADGTFRNPAPSEMWVIPNHSTMRLEDLRLPSLPKTATTSHNAVLELVELTNLRQENAILTQRLEAAIAKTDKLEERARETEAINQYLAAQVAELQTKVYLNESTQERVIENTVFVPVVEKVGNKELLGELNRMQELRLDLLEENARLRDLLESALINQIMVPDEDVIMPATPPGPGASPVEQLDYLLNQQWRG